eukprot:3154135-Prymnesium_polylepis.1
MIYGLYGLYRLQSTAVRFIVTDTVHRSAISTATSHPFTYTNRAGLIKNGRASIGSRAGDACVLFCLNMERSRSPWTGGSEM